MKKNILFAGFMATMLTASAAFVSCDDDVTNPGEVETAYRTITIKNVGTEKDFVQSGTFQGTNSLIQPGESAEIKFYAGKGQYLSFVTMFGNSKDLFFAPENPGIRLFDDAGTPILTNLTAQVKLWDNGTVVNSDPTLNAADQSTGTEDLDVTEIAGTDNQGYSYPAVSDLMGLELTFDEQTSEFTLTINNTSDDTDTPTPFSPGVWAVSNILGGELQNDEPFYTKDEKTTAALTALATTGNNELFKNMIEAETGIVTVLSPVILVVYTGDTNPIFTVGQKDGGIGLKNLAQTGDASLLKTNLERERVVSSVHIFGTTPIAPGQEIVGTYSVKENERIALATMFGYSNDWFFANNTAIQAMSTGNKTSQISLYDNGTAVSQYPGAGNSQSSYTNSPIAEDENITAVTAQSSGFPVPATAQIINVTVE